jgi:MFS family permease
VALLLYGAASGPLRQITVAAADMHPSATRGRAVGMVFMGSILGTVLSPAIARLFTARAGVTEHDTIVLTWIVGAALFAFAVPLFLALRPDPLEIGRRLAALRRDSGDPAPPRADFGPDRPIAFAAAVATMSVLWGNMSLGMAMTPVAMRHHDVPLGDIMFAISLHVLGMYAFGVPLGAIADRIGRKPMMFASVLLTGISNFGALAAADYVAQTVFIFLLGVGWSGGVVSATALLSDYTTAEDRGRAFGYAEFITRGALLAFPALGGLLVGRLGFVSAGVAIAATVLVPLYFILRIRRDRPVSAAVAPVAGH